MLATLLKRPAAATGSRLAQRARSMCTVQVDMVCRVFTCKVKDDETAHKLDCAFEDFLDAAAEVEGCAGASRLVCKSEWDYKLILKFEDGESLTRYMEEHHDPIMEQFRPSLEALTVAGFKEQNFVYDDVE